MSSLPLVICTLFGCCFPPALQVQTEDKHILTLDSKPILPVLAMKTPVEVQGKKPPGDRQNNKVRTNEDGNLDGAANTGTFPGGSHPFLHEAFREVQPDKGILIGFSVSTRKLNKNQEAISGVQPIYRVDGKEVYGKAYGSMLVRSGTLVAKEGYAVGAIKCGLNTNFETLQLTFQKIDGNRLVDSDQYDSPALGSTQI